MFELENYCVTILLGVTTAVSQPAVGRRYSQGHNGIGAVPPFSALTPGVAFIV
jgi:hypothetical protein